jgi:flagellar basal body-associated protein FliL
MEQQQNEGGHSILWTIIFILVGLGMIVLGIKFFWDKDKGKIGNESEYGEAKPKTKRKSNKKK